MTYRVKIPKREENRLELVPLEVALDLEQHLSEVARRADETPHAQIAVGQEGALLRYTVRAYSLSYFVDHPTRPVVVHSLRGDGAI